MKNLVPKLLYLNFQLISFCLIDCKSTLPLQQLTSAKQEITRARLFNSEKYAKAEFNDSKVSLLLAQENTFTSKPDTKKAIQFAQTSIDKAQEAIKKSLPTYVKELQKEVQSSLSIAESAMAESLASDYYEQANLLKADGDEIVKNADKKLVNSPQDITVYDDYEKGIVRYKESISVSEKARDLSLSQTQAVIDSTSDIESNLDLIEKYSNENKEYQEKIKSLRTDYKKATEIMETGSLKDGFQKAETIRTTSNEMMAKVILPYAKDRIKQATLKIENADKLINSTTDSSKSSVESDNLSAAKEAFNSSVDLLAKERYYDSIQQSDESIRLAEDIVKNLEKKDPEVSGRNATTKEPTDLSSETNAENEKDSYPTKPKSKNVINSDETTSNSIKWKKHIVKKKRPPETLWQIAAEKKYLGDKNQWRKIYKANKKKIVNPNLIYPNQVILIPIEKNK